MNTNSAFNGSHTENPNCYQQLDLRQIKILRSEQLDVDFDAADNCRLHFTKMKAMNFQDDNPSLQIDIFEYHYELVFYLTSMQDATENCQYFNLIGEPLRLELNFTFPLEHVLNSLYWGNECLGLHLIILVLLEKYLKWILFLSSKYSIVSRYSNIGTLVHHPLTVF